jgi:hypothetical protein
MKKYKVIVFGKKDCEKCKALNHKIDELLKLDEYKDFEKQLIDVMSEDGLIMFCDFDCLNAQRIPSFLILKKDDKQYITIKNDYYDTDEICKGYMTYQYLGLQTDYSNNDGKITSKMIENVFSLARK